MIRSRYYLQAHSITLPECEILAVAFGTIVSPVDTCFLEKDLYFRSVSIRKTVYCILARLAL